MAEAGDIRKTLEHIKKSAGVKRIDPGTIGKIREQTQNWGFRDLEERCEAIGTSTSSFTSVLSVLREKPRAANRRMLHVVFTAELPFGSKRLSAEGKKHMAQKVLSVLEGMGLIEREGGTPRKTPYGLFATPKKVTWVDREGMKGIWKGIEAWNEKPSARAPKTRRLQGQLTREALGIIGVKSTAELTWEHMPKVEALSRLDWKKQKKNVSGGSLRQLRTRLKTIIIEGEPKRERLKPGGWRMREALKILNVRHLKELDEGHAGRVRALRREEWEAKGMKSPSPGSLNSIKRKLGENIAENTRAKRRAKRP